MLQGTRPPRYVDAEGELRTDHDFHIWRRRFMRLHYRMEATTSGYST